MIGFSHKKPCGLFFVLFFLFLSIVLVSEAGAKTRIMPLGDSITQGTSSGVADPDFQVSYRKALYDKLWAAGYVVDDEIFVGTLISGESVADFDPDHEGHPGWRANEIVAGRTGFEAQGKLDEWLNAEEPNIVLLHIGTNDVANGDQDWNEIEDILVVIDDYESASGKPVWVILSLIIDRSCDPFMPPCFKSAETTAFNNNVRDFVFFPRQAGGDKIILVDMQNGADIDYDRWDMGGDMWDNLHPFETGYSKMADVWFSALMEIPPQADAGPDQYVYELDTVKLDASGSMITYGNNPSYHWIQTAGSTVALSDDQDPQATFDVPVVGPDGEILTFKVTMTDDEGLESTDTVNINVLKDAANALFYTPVTPCRIADTRKAWGALSPGGIFSYNVWGAVASQGGNPAECPSPGGEPHAVHLSVAAVPVAGQGHLRLFPFNTPAPNASTLSYKTGSNIANAITVKTCYLCTKDVNIQSFGGTTHVVIDVMGYYYPAP